MQKKKEGRREERREGGREVQFGNRYDGKEVESV